ncbi:hypothetical protein [Mycobacterium sp. MS1601]|uniref:hypothetical protein n=1 Tax=Mycobacterium sp. MS1601 TaxID=1936029 RepID=UPI0012FC9B70|nr:hypothetical protein [Mycobacterium sp. MS1601]
MTMVLGAIAVFIGVLQLLTGLPGAWLSSLQLNDRFGGGTTSSASPPSSPTGTAAPAYSSPSWTPSDALDPTVQGPQTEDPPPVAQPPVIQPSPPTSEAPPATPAVDRIRISTWAYNPAGPLNTYFADNDGGKNVKVSWESSAGGFDVKGGCTSTVRVEGGGYDHAESSSNCSDSMGTYFDVPMPGTYTATVTTYQTTSGYQHSDNISFTIQ